MSQINNKEALEAFKLWDKKLKIKLNINLMNNFIKLITPNSSFDLSNF